VSLYNDLDCKISNDEEYIIEDVDDDSKSSDFNILKQISLEIQNDALPQLSGIQENNGINFFENHENLR